MLAFQRSPLASTAAFSSFSPSRKASVHLVLHAVRPLASVSHESVGRPMASMSLLATSFSETVLRSSTEASCPARVLRTGVSWEGDALPFFGRGQFNTGVSSERECAWKGYLVLQGDGEDTPLSIAGEKRCRISPVLRKWSETPKIRRPFWWNSELWFFQIPC